MIIRRILEYTRADAATVRGRVNAGEGTTAFLDAMEVHLAGQSVKKIRKGNGLRTPISQGRVVAEV